MGRLAKTGLAILGLAAIGGFVSLLGGPNVFSTFSNAISTILPESEVAVLETEEKQTQKEVVTPPKPEEREEIGSEDPAKEPEEIAAAAKIVETPQPSPALVAETKAEAQLQSSVIVSPTPAISTPVTSLAKSRNSSKATPSASGGKQYGAPSPTKGAGSQGFGRWCVTSSGVTFIEEGGTCMGWRLKDGELVKVD